MRETLVKTEEFKDSPVGRIPKNWQVVKLLDHVSLPNGQLDPNQKPYCDWILIAPDHIESETGRLLNPQTAAEQNAISGKYGFQPGDVLYSKIRPYLRKAVLADREGLCSADMYPLRPGSTIVPRFLLAVILGEDFSRFATAVSMRSGFPKLNREELGEYWLALPPYEEQKRIGEILDTVDKTIAHTSSLIAKLKLMKAGLLHDLLTRGLDENGELRDAMGYSQHFKDSPLGRIPKDWETPTFEEVTVDDSPICYGIVQPGSHVESGVPVIAIQNLNTDYRTNIHKSAQAIESRYVRSRVCSNDLLLSVKGTIGRVGIVPSWFIGNISRDVARIRLKSLASPQYVRQMLLAPSSQKRLEQAVVGTTRAEISIGILRKLRLPLPSLPEQELIADVLNVHDTRIRTEEAYRDKLKLQKQGLMHDLLTGKVRVNDADKSSFKRIISAHRTDDY